MHKFAELQDELGLANAGSAFSKISPRWFRTVHMTIPGSGMLCRDGQNCRISDPLYTLLSILSLGIIALLGELYPVFKLKLSKQECAVKDATCCLVELCDGEAADVCVCWTIDRCQFASADSDSAPAQQSTVQSRYGDLADEEAEQVAMLPPQHEQELLIALQVRGFRLHACSELDDDYALHVTQNVTPGFARFLQSYEDLDSSHAGLDERSQERALLRTLYGANSLNVPKVNVSLEIVRAILSPFSIAALLIAGLWQYQAYYFNTFLGVLGAASIVWFQVAATVTHRDKLAAFAELDDNEICISNYIANDTLSSSVPRLSNEVSFRSYGSTNNTTNNGNSSSSTQGDHFASILSKDLVVGDRVVLTSGMVLPCDVILVQGRIVLDDSLLTGSNENFCSKIPLPSSSLLHGELERTRLTSLKAQAKLLTTLENDSAEEFAATKAQDILLAQQYPGSYLVGGATILQTTENCFAIVYKAGVYSHRSELLQELLKPDGGVLRGLASDIILAILVTMLLAGLMFWPIISYNLYKHGADGYLVMLYFADVLGGAVPVDLSLAILIIGGISFAILRKVCVFVHDLGAFSASGAVSVVAFDTVGALINSDQQLEGFDCAKSFLSGISTSKENSSLAEGAENAPGNIVKMPVGAGHGSAHVLPELVQEALATCNLLKVLKQGGRDSTTSSLRSRYHLRGGDSMALEGSTLDKDLLRASGWTRQGPSANTNFLPAALPPIRSYGNTAHSATDDASFASGSSGTGTHASMPWDFIHVAPPRPLGKYIILNTMQYTARLWRCACLVRRPTGEIVYFVKGDPKFVMGLCRPDTVLPEFVELAASYVRQGMTVVALAYRKCIESNRVLLGTTPEGHEAKPDIIFVGLLYLSHRVKPRGKPTVQALRSAGIHTVIVTNDSPYSALAVGQKCGVIGALSDKKITDTDDTANAITIANASATSADVIVAAQSELLLSKNMLSVLVDANDTGELVLQNTAKFAPVEESLLALLLRAALFDVYGDDLISTTSAANANADEENSSMSTPPVQKPVEFIVTREGLCAVRRRYSAAVLNALIRHTKIFSKCGPLDKQFVTRQLMKPPKELPLAHLGGAAATLGGAAGAQDMLFCGDGANDLPSLKAATVGCSVGRGEASVVANITSSRSCPSSVLDVLHTGRSFILTVYAAIQFCIICSALLCFKMCLLLTFGAMESTQMMWISTAVYQGLGGFAIILSSPAVKLSQQRPPKTFFNKKTILHMASQIMVLLSFHWCLFFAILPAQTWYKAYHAGVVTSSLDNMAVECTVSLIFGLGQFLIAAICSSYGEPFRQEWYANNWLVGWLTVGTIGIAFMCLDISNSVLQYLMPMKPFPISFGRIILGYLFLNAVVSLWLKSLLDKFFVDKAQGERLVPLFTPVLREAHDTDARGTKELLVGNACAGVVGGEEMNISGGNPHVRSILPTERSEIY